MKKIYLFAAAALAMASCTNDEYLGDATAEAQLNNDGAILFSPTSTKLTRATQTGAAAAGKLNNRFVVGGFKGNAASVVTTCVFDHYSVVWEANTAGKTASNTSDWEYVGKTKDVHSSVSEQTIKYWDYSASQYDFIAYSTSDLASGKLKTGLPSEAALSTINDDELRVTNITPSTASNSTGGAYIVGGTASMLEKFYLADLVTVPETSYGQEVMLTFRNVTAKVRIGLYETVPGYSIKDVKFYTDNTTPACKFEEVTGLTVGTSPVTGYYTLADGVYTKITTADAKAASDVTYYQITGANDASTISTTPALFSASSNIYSKADLTVYYNTTNANSGTTGHPSTDLNKAHIVVDATNATKDSKITFDALNYANAKNITGSSVNYLGEQSNQATYPNNSSTKPYSTVIPNESGTALTLRVNYTLVSNDGSSENITVYGAKAVVPAEFCQWKSNYAYTYLFKISDNTNGATDFVPDTPEGLFPITFDASVVQTEDGIQETVTTVATPSITTYSPGTQPTANNEYLQGKDIYVQVIKTDGTNTAYGDLNTASPNEKSWAYTVTGSNISEATVIDALQMGTNSSGTITGRNGIVLAPITGDAAIDNGVTAIPGVNGNDIVVTAGTTAKFGTGNATATLAYVYDFTTSATPSDIYSAVEFAASAEKPDGFPTGYYKDHVGTAAADADWNNTTAQVFYQKYTNNGRSYAVKVIKVQ